MSDLLKAVDGKHVFEVFLFETLDKLDLTSSGSRSNQPPSDENPNPGMMSKICCYCSWIKGSEGYPESLILSNILHIYNVLFMKGVSVAPRKLNGGFGLRF